MAGDSFKGRFSFATFVFPVSPQEFSNFLLRVIGFTNPPTGDALVAGPTKQIFYTFCDRDFRVVQ
jgi:hypothetical protein